MQLPEVLRRSELAEGFVGPDIIPNILSLYNLFLHCRQKRINIALLVKLSLVCLLRNLYVGILLRCSGIDEIVWEILLLTEFLKLFLEGGAVVCLDCFDGKGKV